MKTSLLVILILFQFSLGAQEWFPIGATWHYEQLDYFPPYDDDYVNFEITGDTIIDDIRWKIMQSIDVRYSISERKLYETFGPIFLIRESDNTVKIRGIEDSIDYLYMDFSAQKGDTLRTYVTYGKPVLTRIDSVFTMTYNGFDLKAIEAVIIDGHSTYDYWHTLYIEYAGSTSFFFPQSGAADPPWGGPIRCYSDSNLGRVKFSEVDCDFIFDGNDSCNQDELTFIAQWQIDQFSVNFGICDTIVGDLTLGLSQSRIDNVRGLHPIRIVNGNFEVSDLWGLRTFEGMENLKSIGGNFKLYQPISLKSFDSLKSLEAIGGDFSLNSSRSLTSLRSTENIESITGRITLWGNQSLDTCATPIICDRVFNNPESLYIANNGPLCSSIEDIREQCLLISTEKTSPQYIKITPNPTTNWIEIQSELLIDGIQIIDPSSGDILIQVSHDLTLNVDKLPSGLYILRVFSSDQVSNHKVVIQ